MDYKTHIVGGVGLAYAATQIIPIDDKRIILFYGACLLGSLIPDIDHPKAFISKFIPIIPSLLYKFVGHRTFTHSILFTVLVFLVVENFNATIGTGLSVGITSHIILDMLSPSGVAFLYPFRRKRIKLI